MAKPISTSLQKHSSVSQFISEL